MTPRNFSRGSARHPTPIHSLAASVFEHWTHAVGRGGGGRGLILAAGSRRGSSRLKTIAPVLDTSFLKEPVELPALKMVIITIPLT